MKMNEREREWLKDFNMGMMGYTNSLKKICPDNDLYTILIKEIRADSYGNSNNVQNHARFFLSEGDLLADGHFCSVRTGSLMALSLAGGLAE